MFVEKANSPGGVLKVVHSLLKHSEDDQYRRRVYAYDGDVHGIDINTIPFDTTWLEATDEVHTAEDHSFQQERFLADQELKLIPHADGAARTAVVRTRGCMYIPSVLLPYVLEKDLTAREAFETLLPLIEDENLLQAAAPLVKFLLVATTRIDGDAGPTTAVRMGQLPDPCGARQVIQNRRKNLLYQHLPGLQPAGRGVATASDPALVGIMRCMKDANNAQQAHLDETRADRAQQNLPKTVDKKWPGHVDRLLRLCNVEEVSDLPRYWHEAAAWKKTSGITLTNVLQEAVDLAASELEMVELAPRVTVSHANALQNWNFVGLSQQDIGSGILLFTITPPGATSLQAKERLRRDFEQVNDESTMIAGNTSISATDAKALRGGAYVPVDFDELEAGLSAGGILLGAVLGVEHSTVKSYFNSLRTYTRVKLQLKQMMIARYGEALAAAIIGY